MIDKVSYKKDDRVWFRGEYGNVFSAQGVVQNIGRELGRQRYEVLLDNRSSVWADCSQLKKVNGKSP